ncbi:MAG: polysaccharide pyruvyl transferase family protein [Burkholderiaceae bacterium]|nr:polysaccharide pyruvyl transferase family protein [Burkholderiaceae bacterium]
MDTSVILFGAFDRHNFGDMMFPHVAAAMLPDREPIFAGLAERDLRAEGGHRVEALSAVAARFGDRPATLIHVGGEILTCDAWQAAVMLARPDEARRLVAGLDGRPREQREWAARMLGTQARAPYATVARAALRGPLRVAYLAVGGVELDACDGELRAEVLAALATADDLSVRDRQTQARLRAAGIAARLAPDPAVMIAELFGAKLRARAGHGEVARLRDAFPQGYLAVQFSADFGDDETLARLAAQLDRACASTGLGVALFRAGAAPWHDELDALQRVAARMRGGTAQVFESLDLWDICALVAAARGYCGSSLHGRIVAMAFALPRVNLRHPSARARTGKQAAFASTWDLAEMPSVVDVDDAAAAIERALAADPARLAHAAAQLAARFRETFAAMRERLG